MLEKIKQIEQALPEESLFEGKHWRMSPEAFALSKAEVQTLEKLGIWLAKFQKAANILYRQSFRGKAPTWVSQWLDRGKPEDLINISREGYYAENIPSLIRPDLMLTDEGFALTEIDSVPGGTGLTAWLNQTFYDLGEPICGVPQMRDLLRKRFDEYDVVVAEEAATYRPELEWLYGKTSVFAAESYEFDTKPVYRFFEAFDWSQLETLRDSWKTGVTIDAPMKPFLEEKLWMGLFWLKPLEKFWKRELGERYFRELQNIIPYTWIVEPVDLPPNAVIPGLNIHDWKELVEFSQKQRDLILKISGFSPLAWGSRGVSLGSDMPNDDWEKAVETALKSADRSPYILQPFKKGRLVKHSYWDEETQAISQMEGRARVCPYYLVEGKRVKLLGVLVTICPADKKLIHGMSDAIIVPAKLE